MYLQIGRVALLSAEEEVVLAKAIELGDTDCAGAWKAILSLFEWDQPPHGSPRRAYVAASTFCPMRRMPN